MHSTHPSRLQAIKLDELQAQLFKGDAETCISFQPLRVSLAVSEGACKIVAPSLDIKEGQLPAGLQPSDSRSKLLVKRVDVPVRPFDVVHGPQAARSTVVAAVWLHSRGACVHDSVLHTFEDTSLLLQGSLVFEHVAFMGMFPGFCMCQMHAQ